MPEVSKGEYRAKERQRDRYLRDKAACERQISNLNSEIAELNQAITQMTTVYVSFKSQTKALKKLMGKNDRFSGNQYNSLIGGDGAWLANEATQLQMSSMNSVLDQLEWLRTEKTRQRNEQYGLLGKIKSGLEAIGTWLKTNFFNN